METDNKKFVDFTYCNSCENKDSPEYEDTCNECLNTPEREFSHKPINFKEKRLM